MTINNRSPSHLQIRKHLPKRHKKVLNSSSYSRLRTWDTSSKNNSRLHKWYHLRRAQPNLERQISCRHSKNCNYFLQKSLTRTRTTIRFKPMKISTMLCLLRSGPLQHPKPLDLLVNKTWNNLGQLNSKATKKLPSNPRSISWDEYMTRSAVHPKSNNNRSSSSS